MTDPIRSIRTPSILQRSASIALLGLAPVAVTQASTSEEPATLSPVVAIAARTPQATDDVVLPIIVITAEEIRQRQVTDLGELLATVPGIDIGRNGGPGQAVSLFVRGSESNHVLILIDGLRMNPGTIGGANLQHIDPDQIERIEILRGPRAALYGDQAMGGVISIITRSASGGTGAGASVRTGADRTAGADAHFNLRRADWTIGLAAGLERTDGYAFRRGSSETPGYRNASLNLNIGYSADEASTTFRIWNVDSESEYLDFFLAPLSQSNSNRILQLERVDAVDDAWISTVRLSQAVDDIQQDQSADFVRSQRIALDWLNRFQLNPDMVAGLGVNLEHESASAFSFGSGFDQTTDDQAVYGDLTGGTGPTDWMLALRYSNYQNFSGQVTWNAEYAHQITDDTRLYTAAGTAFRAPDAFDRFGFGGDPSLDPERSISIELGLEHALTDGQDLRLNLYRTEIRDLIEFDLGTFTLMNTDRARIQGLELAYSLVSSGWQFSTAVVLQRPENLTTGTDLARRSRESLDLALSRALGDWTLRTDLQAVGPRLDSPFAPTRLGGYLLLDLSASWRIRPGLTLRLRAENLTDARYQTADGFLGRGRSLFVTLDYQRSQR
jgi:vitamin B12 transporter